MSLAIALGGCSFNYQLDSLFAKSKNEPDITGSLRPHSIAKSLVESPPEVGLAIARAAIGEVLSNSGKDAAVPWENPKTDAHGTITPIASAYSQTGSPAAIFWRALCATAARPGCKGEACRSGRGKWEVRHLKPWQRM